MPDKKLTDNEIPDIKELLEYKAKVGCQNCDLIGKGCCSTCVNSLIKSFIELFNRLQAENERLKTENKLLIENDVSNKYPNCVLVEKGRIYTKTLEDYDNLIGDISAEAYKEFAEKLEAEYTDFDAENEVILPENLNKAISDLLKELVGEE